MNRELEDYYGAVLEDLENDRADLDRLIAYIKRKKFGQGEDVQATPGTGQLGMTTTRPTVVNGASALTQDAFFGLSLVDASHKYLAIVKTPRNAREIAEALLEGGFKTTSKDFNNTVFSVLSREDKNEGTIAKVNKGFGLAEWYPGLKRGKSQNKPIPIAPHEIVADSCDTSGKDSKL